MFRYLKRKDGIIAEPFAATILVVVFLLLASFFVNTFLTGSREAAQFKNDYESLNGVEISEDRKYRTVIIGEMNPMEEITLEDVVKKIENGETFYLYVGDEMCPWCRASIETALNSAKNNGIKKIYYVQIWDEDHNEIFRNILALDENGTVFSKKAGTDAYYTVRTQFEPLLSDYTLKDNDGNIINTGEKRIYAPNYFYVNSGKLACMTNGTSELLASPYDELTEEIKADQKKIFDSFFSESKACEKRGNQVLE